MFQIIQSNDTDVLVEQLMSFYQKNQQDGSLADLIFKPFTVIVPSMVLGDWLNKQVALRAGISTLLTAQFWGQYQWRMIDKVLQADARIHDDALAVPEVAVLSGAVMRWRIFGFLNEKIIHDLPMILADETHVLHFLFKPLVDESEGQIRIMEHRLWQVCDELAKVYVRYLTHRPEWLHAWGVGEALPVSVDEMITQKDKFGDLFAQHDGTPEWLFEHYRALEGVLRYLWSSLFYEVYAYREALEARFWQVLDGERGEEVRQLAMNELPKELYLFTVQQMPQVELMFLKRLSLKINIRLLHFNPSRMFWADIVDKNWLMTQKIIQPNMVYLKDYGHGLLSRLGKESRETFAMLADMSGGEFYYEHEPSLNQAQASQADSPIMVDWQDKFVLHSGEGILQRLKQDILMLGEDGQGVAMAEMLSVLTQKTRTKPVMNMTATDDSDLPELSMHACHGLKRQLEIARTMIAKYLNAPNQSNKRSLSDVVILLPDVEEAKSIIRAVFPDGVGADGLHLPIKITGVTDRSIDELMQAIVGFYRLLGAKDARFYRDEFYEWLMNPALYESFGLSFEEVYRARQLLDSAGFKRGFDARHISATLHDLDMDYRYTFSYALDRIVMGFVAPDSQSPSDTLYPFAWKDGCMADATLALDGINLNDAPIVTALCSIHEALSRFATEYQRVDSVHLWLQKIESDVIDVYFYKIKQSTQMRAIFEAKNAMMSSLRANLNYHKYSQAHGERGHHDDIRLSLEFVLESLAQTVGMQAIAAEPAGVITVARFGALRSIPFGLTIMLGMNLSAFPRQDNNMRLDLMKAGLKRRGDRTNEDDDNGAFLDALLCTKDACAIFYDGMSADGSTILLPASPVGELLEFLKSDVHWQWHDEHSDTAHVVAELLPSMIERYLVTYHDAMSFEQSVFYEVPTEHQPDDIKGMLMHMIDEKKREQKLALPPAPLWQQVRQVIDEPKQPRQAWISLPSAEQIQEIHQVLSSALLDNKGAIKIDALLERYDIEVPSYLSVRELTKVIKSPILAYLRGKFAITRQADDIDLNEPLSLNHLDNWALRQAILDTFRTGVFDDVQVKGLELQTLIGALGMSGGGDEQTKSLQRLHHDALLPAGVVKTVTLQESFERIVEQVLAFADELGVDVSSDERQLSKLLSDVHEVAIDVCMGSHRLKVLAEEVPVDDTKTWLNILASKSSADKLIRFWVQHLIWQIYRGTDERDIIEGNGVSIWHYQDASAKLKKLGLDTGATYRILPIDAKHAKAYLVNFIVFVLLSAKIPMILTPMNALLLANDDEPVEIDEREGELYQKALEGSDDMTLLKIFDKLSLTLYQAMLKNMAVFQQGDKA